MNKVLEALKKLLPEEKFQPVAEAVQQAIEESKQELETEYNAKLEEAYAQLAKELKDAESTAEKGYQEAYSIIEDLRTRLETQNAEWQQAMDEGYEEAYQMLIEQRGKAEKLEVEIYEEYDKKLSDMKSYMVDKLDEFLAYKAKDMAQAARRAALNDSTVAEHKVALDKVVDILSDYITDDDYALATSSKLEEALKMLEDLRAKQRILEARNINLSRENKKLNESVRGMEQTITESKKAKVESKKNVTGRGKKELDNVEVIAEHNAATSSTTSTKDADTTIAESFGSQLDAMRVLAGLQKNS
jgi:hypothetical protein